MTYESMYNRFFLENETKFQPLPKYTIFVLLQISTLHIDTGKQKKCLGGKSSLFLTTGHYTEKRVIKLASAA
jgi:hypothetical protein